MSETFLSIVIPAYNEALRIGRTLEKVCQYLGTRNYPCELIVVDDGSRDETPHILEAYRDRNPRIRILSNESNRGKGYTVRRGVLEARGEFILFTDADLSAPIEETNKLLGTLESSGADVALGSRALDRRLIGIHQPWRRELAGRVFNFLVRLFTGLKLRDTQCGLKLFRRTTTRRAFELQQVKGFGFDPEVLFLVQRLGGKIVEVPVRWNDSPITKVRLLRDSSRMLWDLLAVRWRALTGEYKA